MCHKTNITFAPCGHTLPVILRCEDIQVGQLPCNPPTEIPSPEETPNSEEHCPDCEEDSDLQRLKILLAENPHDRSLQPTQPVQQEIPEDQKDWYIDDDDPVKALEKAMAANPELFAEENKAVDHFVDDDPLVALNKYLDEHPEEAQVKVPELPPTGYTYKFKEMFSFCGHWGNFTQTDWDRQEDDQEWIDGLRKGYCPGCEEILDDPKRGLVSYWKEAPRLQLNDDPHLQGRALGYIPQPFVHRDDFDFPKPPPKEYAGNSYGSGSGVDRFEPEATPAGPVVPTVPTAVTPASAPIASTAPAERTGPPKSGPPGYALPFDLESPALRDVLDMDEVYSEMEDTSIGKGKGKDQSPGYEGLSADQGSQDSSLYRGTGRGRADGRVFDNHNPQPEGDNEQEYSDERSDYTDDDREAHGDEYEHSEDGDLIVLNEGEQEDSYERGRTTRRHEDWFRPEDAAYPATSQHGYAQGRHPDDDYTHPLQDDHYRDGRDGDYGSDKDLDDTRIHARSQTPSPEPHAPQTSKFRVPTPPAVEQAPDPVPQDHTSAPSAQTATGQAPSAAAEPDARDPAADASYGDVPMPAVDGPDTTGWSDAQFLAEVHQIEQELKEPKTDAPFVPFYRGFPPRTQYRSLLEWRKAANDKKSGQIPETL
jgi:hypothetical protein